MPNRSNNKGAEGEREVERLFQAAGFPLARRALGAGRKDDVGDMHGLPHLCLQIARRGNGTSVIWQKLPTVETERRNRRVRFGALWLRYDRKPWIVILTPAQFIRLYKYALRGIAAEKAEKSATMTSRDRRKRTSRS